LAQCRWQESRMATPSLFLSFTAGD